MGEQSVKADRHAQTGQQVEDREDGDACQVCQQAIPRPTSGAIVTTAVMMPSRVSFATDSTSPARAAGKQSRGSPAYG